MPSFFVVKLVDKQAAQRQALEMLAKSSIAEDQGSSDAGEWRDTQPLRGRNGGRGIERAGKRDDLLHRHGARCQLLFEMEGAVRRPQIGARDRNRTGTPPLG